VVRPRPFRYRGHRVASRKHLVDLHDGAVLVVGFALVIVAKGTGLNDLVPCLVDRV
jgi:hypothetical protein